jgi:hypothetical protein
VGVYLVADEAITPSHNQKKTNMIGTITFETAEELAKFLGSFGQTNTTCTFDVCQKSNGTYLLTFDGGK